MEWHSLQRSLCCKLCQHPLERIGEQKELLRGYVSGGSLAKDMLITEFRARSPGVESLLYG